MRSSAKLVARVICLLAFGALCAARASSVMYMSVDQMARTAPLIVRARCTANASHWDAGEIWTFTTFEVEETWRGTTARQVTVRLLGGTAGHITSHVSGVPRFRPGEDTVLFLEPTSRGDFSVVGWQQGTFRLRSNAANSLYAPPRTTATQDGAALATFDPATRRFIRHATAAIPLEMLRSQVESALRHAGELYP